MTQISTLINDLSTTEWLILSIAVALYLALAGHAWARFRGYGGKVGPLKDRLNVNKQLEDLEYRTADLVGRFNRFQKREGMREARSAIDVQNEAADILGADTSSSPAAGKTQRGSVARPANWFRKKQ